MSREEFLKKREDSAKRMREMYGEQNRQGFPSFVRLPEKPQETQGSHDLPEGGSKGTAKTFSAPAEIKSNMPSAGVTGILNRLNIGALLKNSDGLLILGLILLLINDSADEKLILALVFILL